MSSILFIDSVTYKPYNAERMKTESLGGSEASLIRIAQGLSRRGHRVHVYQHVEYDRTTETIDDVTHIGLESKFSSPDYIVHFRTGRELPAWTNLFPKAKHFVWMEDLAGPWCKTENLENEVIIAVSDFHKRQIEQTLLSVNVGPKEVVRIYNPVVVPESLQFTPKNMHKLGFFSSPHKGLEQVIGHFKRLLARFPKLELVVGNPGYAKNSEATEPNVRILGDLAHDKAMEELSSCGCLFYPQTVFPETFGIVMGEANALHVPVIAHRFGASKEVCSHTGNEIIDCTKPEKIDAALESIITKPRFVATREEFKLEAVLDSWENLFKGAH